MQDIIGKALFVDFEASGLELARQGEVGPMSWPIEVGFAWIDKDLQILSKSKLIRPHESWNMKGWNVQSEKIHNIPLQKLMDEGEPADQVARWFLDPCEGRYLISDAPQWETYWTKTLMSTDQIDWPHKYQTLLSLLPVEDQMAAYQYLCTSEEAVVHRAAPDAEQQARHFLSFLRFSGKLN